MDFYRITFHQKTKAEHTADFVSLEAANHFHVMRNNTLVAEEGKPYWALTVLNNLVGPNIEVERLMKEISRFMQNKYFQCMGITFSEKFGVRLEMKLREDIQ